MNQIDADENIRFDEYTHNLLEKIKTSIECEKFLQSIVGRYLYNKAAKENLMALHDLLEVDPNDKVKITQLQERARTTKNFIDWLQEALKTGQECEYQIQQLEIG